MLKFKCDRCGKEMQRGEAWAIVLAPGAYAAEGARERTQGEICGDCAEILLKEMIYMEVPAADCHVGLRLPRNDMKKSACDGEVPAQARQGCRALQGSDGGACDVGVPAPARRVDCAAVRDEGALRMRRAPCGCAPYGESGACTRADDSRRYGEDVRAKKTARNAEGRCITVARVRMGMSQKQLADLMYTEDSTISSYERGQVKKIPWDELYRVMPELEEIRKNGCKAYCEDPTACLGGGKCYYARRW